jgi:hypothetical protein
MNFDHPANRVLITGMTGSGKTTFWLRRLVSHRARFKFVFDPMRETSRKLGWPVCIDEPGLVNALAANRPVCFDSSRLFPGDRRQGFAFFSRWVFNVAKVMRGVKLFACDEFQSVQKQGDTGLPQGFKEITDEGRREEIDTLLAAQRLNEVNDDVRAGLTEIVTFRHCDPLALRWLAERGFDPAAVSKLPSPGGYIQLFNDGRIKTNARVHRAGKANRRPVATR